MQKMEKMQLTLEALDAKLSKHIGFIDKYEGLKSPRRGKEVFRDEIV